MPRAKISTKKSPSRSAKDDEALMDFEQFVSQKPATRGGRNKGLLLTTLLIVIGILAAVLYYLPNNSSLVKESKFIALSLDNNQVYYAKIVQEDALNIYLDEVYYIQVEERVLPPEEEDGEPQTITVPILVKRGEELHKPQGWLQINRQKVVAIEEIGEDSEILEEINKLNQ